MLKRFVKPEGRLVAGTKWWNKQLLLIFFQKCRMLNLYFVAVFAFAYSVKATSNVQNVFKCRSYMECVMSDEFSTECIKQCHNA